MTTQNGGHPSLGPIPSSRLNKLRDIDKWPSLRMCLSVCGLSVSRELEPYLCSRDGLNSTVSPAVKVILSYVKIYYITRQRPLALL